MVKVVWIWLHHLSEEKEGMNVDGSREGEGEEGWGRRGQRMNEGKEGKRGEMKGINMIKRTC